MLCSLTRRTLIFKIGILNSITSQFITSQIIDDMLNNKFDIPVAYQDIHMLNN